MTIDEVEPFVLQTYHVLDLIGVVLNGIIGGTIARQRGFDIVGFLFLALFSALGGGMIRDTLIQQGAPAAISDWRYLTLAFVGALIAALTRLENKAWEFVKAHGDAIILGVWAVTGATKALNYDLPILSVIFMGVLTAAGGGMLRDIACAQIPSVFGGNTLYVVPSVIASLSMALFHYGSQPVLGMIISPLAGYLLALVSYYRGWVIPTQDEFAPVNRAAHKVARHIPKARGISRRWEGKREDPR
nr:trimeric intracellular cation channel family protein [Corynebacterium cystitidis]